MMTPIKSKCVVCGQDIGDSSLWIGGRIYHPECSPYHQSMQSADLKEARRELAEARTQVASNWDEMGEANRKLQTELFEARAQIAAKDAALREAAIFFECVDEPELLALMDKALAKPARETE
jgi:ribosomal protein L29